MIRDKLFVNKIAEKFHKDGSIQSEPKSIKEIDNEIKKTYNNK